MPLRTTYTQARANLAGLCEKVTSDREVVIIQRRGRADVALVSADELQGMSETVHLLRSPRNRDRLLRAMKRAKQRALRPQTIEKLRADLGLSSNG